MRFNGPDNQPPQGYGPPPPIPQQRPRDEQGRYMRRPARQRRKSKLGLTLGIVAIVLGVLCALGFVISLGKAMEPGAEPFVVSSGKVAVPGAYCDTKGERRSTQDGRLAVCAYGQDGGSSASRLEWSLDPSSPQRGAKVAFEVTGTGKADISYSVNGTGGSANGVTLPWTLELGPYDNFVVLSMVAMVKGGTTSTAIKGKIIYGNKVWECNGQGPYAVATCVGSD